MKYLFAMAGWLAIVSVHVTSAERELFTKEWTKMDIRDNTLIFSKSGQDTPMYALFGVLHHKSNQSVDYMERPNWQPGPKDSPLLEDAPHFDVRLNDSARIFVQVDQDYYELLLEQGNYRLEKSPLKKAEFKKMYHISKKSTKASRDEFVAELNRQDPIYPELKGQPIGLVKPWKEKYFKSCGNLKYEIVYDYIKRVDQVYVDAQAIIVFPDDSRLRVASYYIDTIRCSSTGRVSVLLSSPVAADPVYYKPSVVMLDTGIDFAAHEEKSKKK
jgi:hypothetical protein